MKKRYWILIGISLLLLVGVLSAGSYFKNRSYDTISPKMGDVLEAVYGLGTVKSHHFYEFKAGTVVNLEHIYAREGVSVKKGDPLLKFSNGLVVKAPFAGSVTDLPFHEGNIPAYQMVIQLQDLGKKYIEVSLEQEGALRVQKGQKTKVMFESLKGTVYPGEVTSLFPKKGSFMVHIEVKDLDRNILPGMTADVSIEIGKHQNVLLIPISSIDAGKVIRFRADKKKKVKVKLGHVDGSWAEVTEGDIKLSDLVVIPKIKKQRK